MWDKAAKLVSSTLKPISTTIDNLHTSKEEKLQAQERMKKLQNQLIVKMIDFHEQELEAKKEVILAEAKGSWLQRNWRPILMLTIVAIVANNYLLYPYLSLFTSKAILLELPEKLWNLMLVGVGGYVAGRSGEKIVEEISKKS